MSKDRSPVWVTEKGAAGIIQLPGTFLRRSVEEGSLKGQIKHMPLRKYSLYNKVDLENYIYENPCLADL